MEAFLLYSKKSHIKRPVMQQHTVIVISNLRVSAIAIMESFFSLSIYTIIVRRIRKDNKNKKITRNELTNMKLLSTMKLRLKYNKIAYLCRKHNRQGADRIIRESTYGVRIIGDSPSGMDSASSMEDALFFCYINHY